MHWSRLVRVSDLAISWLTTWESYASSTSDVRTSRSRHLLITTCRLRPSKRMKTWTQSNTIQIWVSRVARGRHPHKPWETGPSAASCLSKRHTVPLKVWMLEQVKTPPLSTSRRSPGSQTSSPRTTWAASTLRTNLSRPCPTLRRQRGSFSRSLMN